MDPVVRGTVVLYSPPAIGHLVPLVELAKLLLRHRNYLNVVVVLVQPPLTSGYSSMALISSISAAHPSISFHHLPPVDLSHLVPTTDIPEPLLLFETTRLSNPNFLAFLSSLPPPSPVAILVDMFCCSAVDVGRKLDVPVYMFFTSTATGLALLLQFPALHASINQSFKDLGKTMIDVPGVPPIPADHMPSPFLESDGDSYRVFLHLSTVLRDMAGVVVNTFESLEQKAVQFIRDEFPTLPVYCVGPLINKGPWEQPGHPCLTWLDSQPKGSVVFLSFGSRGRFSARQLAEIAVGLENSGQRFLWVVRSPPTTDRHRSVPQEASDYDDDLESLLPEGFLARTRAQGLVVKAWVPQGAVLGHEAVGGFVTHLGWNSVLESVCAGVAMSGWPLYAEQRMNRVFVVDDMKLALAMEGYDGEVVSAQQVESAVRGMMESEVGGEVRRRCLDAMRAAEIALGEGGISYVALDELVQCFFRNKL